MMLEELRRHREQILSRATACKLANVRVFGSVARGDTNATSDIDFLVTPLPKAGLDFFAFANEMEDLLGVKVDLVSDRAINPLLKDAILQDAVPL